MPKICPKCKGEIIFTKGIGHSCDCPITDLFDVESIRPDSIKITKIIEVMHELEEDEDGDYKLLFADVCRRLKERLGIEVNYDKDKKIKQKRHK